MYMLLAHVNAKVCVKCEHIISGTMGPIELALIVLPASALLHAHCNNSRGVFVRFISHTTKSNSERIVHIIGGTHAMLHDPLMILSYACAYNAVVLHKYHAICAHMQWLILLYKYTLICKI